MTSTDDHVHVFEKRTADAASPTMTFAEALASYELVDIVDDPDGVKVMIMASPSTRGDTETGTPGFNEIGTTSPSTYLGFLRQEYNPDLRGVQGLQTYDKMRRSDSTVRAVLRLMKTPVLSARWFVKPASDSSKDRAMADFVSWNLFKGMSNSWPQLLTEALLCLDYGYYMFEKVFTNKHPMKPGMVCWQKFAPRHPLDVLYWEFDAKGGPAGVQMYNYSILSQIFIPIQKMAVFTFEKEAGDMQGMSLLRSAYKPWFYKQQLEKIDAIQKERHGIGIPIIRLPPGFNKDDRIAADNLGRNLRTNERAHVVLPPNWDLVFAKLEGQPVSALDSISYHDDQIEMNVLGNFIDMESKATKDEDHVMFMRSTRFLADCVEDIFNSYCIPQLIDYNFKRVPNGYPELKARRIGEQEDWRTMSFTLRNAVGAGIVTPDDDLETFAREEFDLPPADPKTARNIGNPQGAPELGQSTAPPPTPAAPGQRPAPANQQRGASGSNVPSAPKPSPAGLPRQNPRPVVSVPRGNAGVDRSGK